MCYILCMCVCVGASDTTTASGNDRPMPDLAVKREMCELHARIDAMETTQRRTVNAGDISEAESENEAGH